MDAIMISTLATLASKWQAAADAAPGYQQTDYGDGKRETLRACAGTLRILCETRFEDCPHAAPHHYYCVKCQVKPCQIGRDQPNA